MAATISAMGDSERAGTEVVFEDFLYTSPPRDKATDVGVTVFVGEDGATVVQIDTHGDDRMRVNINDSTVFDRGVESDAVYEDQPREWVVIAESSVNSSDAVEVFDCTFMNDADSSAESRRESFEEATETLARMRKLRDPGLRDYIEDIEQWRADRMAP